jgi:hypothetical protein
LPGCLVKAECSELRGRRGSEVHGISRSTWGDPSPVDGSVKAAPGGDRTCGMAVALSQSDGLERKTARARIETR